MPCRPRAARSICLAGSARYRVEAADTPDIVLLDLGLPDGDGKDVIRAVRKWSNVPIIVLSARDREAEKIEALDLGGDDFVIWPAGLVSLTCFGLNVGLLQYLYAMERPKP